MKYALAGLLLCFIASASSASVLYRYKDENDRIVLGITVPPQYVQKGYEILNSNGRVIEVVPRALTPAEIAERKRKEKLQAEKEKQEAEQKAADEALLKIYSHPDDALRTLTRKLQDIQAVIKLKIGSIDTDKNKLSDAQTRAANKERAGEKVPEKLLQEIDKYHQEIKRSQTEIASLKQEMHAVYDEFSDIIERLKLLTGKETKTELPDELKILMGLMPAPIPEDDKPKETDQSTSSP